jgi:pyrroline-5-carboxylate reductase
MAVDRTIAFLGGGNMAEALIKGLLAARVSVAERITVTDVSESRLGHLQRTYGVRTQTNNALAVAGADIVVLAVKPQVIDAVLSGIVQATDGNKLVVSIAAGVTIGRIERTLTGRPRVVRVMPNTPALVLAGAAGIAAGPTATESDVATVKEIFGAVGRAVVVDEKLMDAVTGLSGSGPAYVFTVIEALADGGVKAGIARPLALELAAQTVFGASKMVLETKEHPAKLRDMVTSPGGTTIAGMHELEKGRLRAALMSAVDAATKRSKELGGAAAPKKARPRKAKTATGKRTKR